MKTRIKLLVLSLAMALFFGAGNAWAEIRIGLMCPLTGSWASEGQDMRDIVQLLAEEVNAAGGINGQQVRILVEDDGGDPRTAVSAANRLATRNVAAVIGTYGSSITEATQNIYDDYGIIQIANGATSIRLTQKGLKYFFRTSPRDDEQGRVAAETIAAMGYNKVAILHDSTSYARGLADETRGLLEQDNKEIVFFDALTPGERDYSTILSRLRNAGPEVVFFTGYFPEAGLLLRQKNEMNWDVPFIGGDATNNPDLVAIAGRAAAEGFYFLSPPVPQDLATPQAQNFLAAYNSKHGSNPGSIWAVLAGDGFLVLAEAMKATGSLDKDELAAYMHNELNIEGLTGNIAFDQHGDRVGELYRLYRVDGEGNFVMQD
ncbi:branched-chain amino acid ABC transporter substrate-binding protein [Desulfonatronovibrio hydrogenovorans]|uniref:branched-chain amino acid ABC transporter substrate-binding protein n=1 Tax=Desulfonatronovibrio hydrogenovorans TaxID=53245 RepID=UPI00048AB010|nr:branched-chain amino acid ABC transporter substrate-binding protein [Desulfonatronovibrio hydrogenovorans]